MDEQQVPSTDRSANRGDPGLAGTLGLVRVAGIEVGVHYTWLIAFALITFSLAVGFFPVITPGYAVVTYWLVGATAALLLFVSVLVHEFSHSLVAKARGIPVQSITLFIFGGVSNIQEEPENPRDEFLIAVVGPVSSLLLAGVFWGIFLVIGPATRPSGALVFYLAIINVILAVFNLLPGFPLDGGRVLRAVLWAITGSLRQATNWASGVGQVFAFLLIIWGVLLIFAGSFLGGIWIAFIGWFLNNAAESSRRELAAREAFRGVRVGDIMTPEPSIVSPHLPVRSMIQDYALRRGVRAVLIAEDGQLAGIATMTDVHKVMPEHWGDTTVGEIMTPAPLVTVGPNVDLQSALRLMGERDLNQLPVVEDGRLVGLLTRSNVIQFLRLREEIGALPSVEEERRKAA